MCIPLVEGMESYRRTEDRIGGARGVVVRRIKNLLSEYFHQSNERPLVALMRHENLHVP